ncbi:MAG: type II toxin-antitoxin system RelE/ParE family toxin [Thermodesulfovibrionales bacterium]|nr:type II toxin-antitoxin system RelE/ParE family toxin [Nitrospinota bacterium]MCG2709422.1 type II toxin-antitoxin system RelE/ParE family toxin [Thermodesulfovibrionales bacterium]MDP3049065.1 type II toxin-antitoxin system RelE/ParE family toxin [Thermodesulfovibrionales bacterium]
MAVKTPVSFAESAVSDLEGIQAYYDSEGAAATGRRLIEELVSAIERLADHPKSGRVVPEFNIEYLREVIKPPFRIVYRCDKKRVRIVRIWRSERILKLP